MSDMCGQCASYHMSCVIMGISTAYCGCKCHKTEKSVH